MSKIVEYVRSRLPGGSANNALTQMMRQDQIRSQNETKRNGLLKRIFCCAGCGGLLKLYQTSFGFRECQEEVDMLTAGLSDRDRGQITEHALRIFRRRRCCGESNYLIACDPIAEGGTKLPAVSILRVSKSCACQTVVRRIAFDARHITQVELSDAWETCELISEIIVFIFGLAAWGYVVSAEPRTDREETMRNNVLVGLAAGLAFLLFVIILNFINTRFFRASQLVIDTCLPGRAMVTKQRFLTEVSIKTENSGANTAQQYIVTLPHPFVLDARQILQHWKQIADNLSTQLNLAQDAPGPSVAAQAHTRNLSLMVPSYARAEVAEPPPGAAVEVVDPQLPPANGEHMQAAQVPEEQFPRPGVNMSQRRRENAHPYMPPV